MKCKEVTNSIYLLDGCLNGREEEFKSTFPIAPSVKESWTVRHLMTY